MKNTKQKSAQVTLEFTFCMIIVLLLLYGSVMAFRWAGVSLAERRIIHDEALYNGVDDNWGGYADSPLKQLNPDFYFPKDMNLIFNNW